jgi:hypothetical protein
MVLRNISNDCDPWLLGSDAFHLTLLLQFCVVVYIYAHGLGSSVGIVTGYGLDGLAIVTSQGNGYNNSIGLNDVRVAGGETLHIMRDLAKDICLPKFTDHR